MTQVTRQVTRERLEVKGRPAAVRRTASLRAPLVFLHGSVAGSSPYCAGSHVWGPVLDRFAAERDVLAVDLPGCGETTSEPALPTVESLHAWLADVIAHLGVGRCFLVGHDLGGLLALEFAARQPERLAGLAVVACPIAAPTGDGVENIVLAHPPPPRWSRVSQRWAFEQLSYAPHHITDDLLDACVAAAGQAPHRAAAAAVAAGALDDELVPSVTRAKGRFYELCRGAGIAVPVQVIWGSHDRLGSLDQGLWLYRLLAARQTAAHFHVINRVGSFPFREDPATFHQIVQSFCAAVLPPPA